MMNLNKNQYEIKKIIALFLSFLILSESQLPAAQAMASIPKFCQIANVELSSKGVISRARSQEISNQTVASFGKPKGLRKIVRLANSKLGDKRFLFKRQKLGASPVKTLIITAARYGNFNNGSASSFDILETKRRAGNIKIPFLPLYQGTWEVLNRPLTPEMLKKQGEDRNIDTNFYEYLETEQIYNTLENATNDDSLIFNKLQTYYDTIVDSKPYSEADSVANIIRKATTQEELLQTYVIPIEAVENNFESLTRKEKEMLAQRLVLITKPAENFVSPEDNFPGNFEDKTIDFLKQNKPKKKDILDKLGENILNFQPPPADSRKEAEMKKQKEITESELKKIFQSIFLISPQTSINESLTYGINASYVPKLGAELATIKFIRAATVEKLSKNGIKFTVVEELLKDGWLGKDKYGYPQETVNLSPKVLGRLAETFRENSNIIANQTGISSTEISQWGNQQVREFMLENKKAKKILDRLSTALTVKDESIRRDLANTDRLIKSLESLEISSQQLSLGGLNMVSERLDSLQKIKQAGNDPVIKNTELKSIQLVLGLTSPIPLESNGEIGVIQQYISNLADSLVFEWEKNTSKENSSFFSNPLVEKLTTLYFENICIPNYNKLLNQSK